MCSAYNAWAWRGSISVGVSIIKVTSHSPYLLLLSTPTLHSHLSPPSPSTMKHTLSTCYAAEVKARSHKAADALGGAALQHRAGNRLLCGSPAGAEAAGPPGIRRHRAIICRAARMVQGAPPPPADRSAAWTLVVNGAKVCGLEASLAGDLVYVRHGRSWKLRLARIHKGALVFVLQRLARVVHDPERILGTVVGSNDVPVLPKGKPEHLALCVRSAMRAGRRVEDQLLVQLRMKALRRRASTVARHGILDVDVDNLPVATNIDCLLPSLRLERIPLALVAIIVGVESHHLVPFARHGRRRRWHESLWRHRGIERPVSAGHDNRDLQAARILDGA
eukprot:scaffold14954_cov122-Isochrysis_galbana.AAC.5